MSPSPTDTHTTLQRPHNHASAPLQRQRLLFFLLSLLASPSVLKRVQAIECLFPSPGTVARPGESVIVAWRLGDYDDLFYSTISATLYCADGTLSTSTWRPVTSIFSNRPLDFVIGQHSFTLPNCGPNARNGAIRIMASGWLAQENSDCYFNIRQDSVFPSPLPPTIAPPVSTVPVVPTPSAPVILPSSDPNPSATKTFSPSLPTSDLTNPPQPSIDLLPPIPPLPPNPSDGTNSGTEGGQTDKPKNMAAMFGSLGMAACLAVLVVSLLVIRRRRRRDRHGSLPRLDKVSSGRHEGGAMGGILRGARHKLQRNKSSQEGYFFQMRNGSKEEINSDDDNDTDHWSAREGQPTMASISHRSGPGFVATGVMAAAGASAGVGAGTRSTMKIDPSITFPSDAYMDPSRRRSSLPFTDSSYSLSSMRSSFETSSVVRKYWAASMAARAERRLDGHVTPTEDLSDALDSDSRMADIISTAGSTGTRAGHLHHHRRNTLNTLNTFETDSLRRTRTPSFSSRFSMGTDDSELQHHYRGRASLEAMTAQNARPQEPYAQQFQYRQQQHHYQQDLDLHHHQKRASTLRTSTGLSRPTSSAPSLTSTNDPFKTFDSGEILVDLDPFSDHHALVYSRQSSPGPSFEVHSSVDGNEHDDELQPPLALGGETRSNSSLLRSFPSPPTPASRSPFSSTSTFSTGHS